MLTPRCAPAHRFRHWRPRVHHVRYPAAGVQSHTNFFHAAFKARRERKVECGAAGAWARKTGRRASLNQAPLAVGPKPVFGGTHCASGRGCRLFFTSSGLLRFN